MSHKKQNLVCWGLLRDKEMMVHRMEHLSDTSSVYFREEHLSIIIGEVGTKKGKNSGSSYLSGSCMVSIPLPAICCSLWADWSVTAVKTIKGRSQTGEGWWQCQFPSKTLWTAGPWGMLWQSLAWWSVWCYSQEWVQPLLVWNPRKMSLPQLMSTCTACDQLAL